MTYSADFRNKVVQLYNSGTSTADLCAQFHISRSILYQMKIPSIKNLLLLLICP